MATINALDCTSHRGNTGWGRCSYDPQYRRFAILVPKGTIITAEQLSDVITYLRGKLTADSYVSRFFAFGPFEDWEDQSEDRAQQTLGSGRKVTTKDPTEQLVYSMLDGGLCTQKNNLDFDGAHTGYDILYIDKNNVMQAQVTTDANGQIALKGFDMGELYVFPFKQPTSSTVALFRISIEHTDAKQMQRDMAVVDLNTSFATMRQEYAIQNAVLSNVTPGGAAAGVFHVAVMGGCGSDNLAVLYPTLLANIARFVVKNHATQAAITITTAALNTAGTAIVLTLSTVDTDYPTPPALIDISLASPQTLGTAGMKWYESYVPAGQTGALQVAAT